MKKLLLLFIAATCFIACQKGPDDVITAFVKAAQNDDSDAMREYYKSGEYIIHADYNTINIKEDFTLNETPKYLINTDTLKLSVWESKIGTNEVTWTVEERKNLPPVIKKSSGLYVVDSVKLKKETGLNSIAIAKDMPDDSIPSFVRGIPVALKEMKRFGDHIDGVQSFGNYNEKEDYSPIKLIYAPDNTDGWNLLIGRPTRIGNNKEYDVYFLKDDHVAYIFTSKNNRFFIKVQRVIPKTRDDETSIGRYGVTSTKGFIDANDISIGKNLSVMDDQDILMNVAKYTKHQEYAKNVIMFKSGGYIEGTTHQRTAKNYSDKQIKYLTYYFVGNNSVGDLVSVGPRVMFNIKLIGPISPGDEFRLDVNTREFWGDRSQFVVGVKILRYDVEFTDGTKAVNLTPHWIKEFD